MVPSRETIGLFALAVSGLIAAASVALWPAHALGVAAAMAFTWAIATVWAGPRLSWTALTTAELHAHLKRLRPNRMVRAMGVATWAALALVLILLFR